ncbi:hypothetical protein V6N13_090921 [Hibiscus sabdariffa]
MNMHPGVSRRGRADEQQQSGAQTRNNHIEARGGTGKPVHTKADRQGRQPKLPMLRSRQRAGIARGRAAR